MTTVDIIAHSTEQFPDGLYIRQSTGEVFASIRSLSALVQKSVGSVSAWLEPRRSEKELEMAEVLTNSGVQGVRLIPENLILEAIAKYNPQLLAACAGAGLRVYLHRLAGFEVQSTAIAPPKSDRELMLEAQLEAEKWKAQLFEVKAHEAETKKLLVEKENYILNAERQRPGLAHLMEEAQEEIGLKRLTAADQTWTIYEWMTEYAKKKWVLEDSAFRKLVSKVHGAYKALYNQPPKKEWRSQVANPKASKLVQVYQIHELPLLEICYRDTVKELTDN